MSRRSCDCGGGGVRGARGAAAAQAQDQRAPTGQAVSLHLEAWSVVLLHKLQA